MLLYFLSLYNLFIVLITHTTQYIKILFDLKFIVAGTFFFCGRNRFTLWYSKSICCKYIEKF